MKFPCFFVVAVSHFLMTCDVFTKPYESYELHLSQDPFDGATNLPCNAFGPLSTEHPIGSVQISTEHQIASKLT